MDWPGHQLIQNKTVLRFMGELLMSRWKGGSEGGRSGITWLRMLEGSTVGWPPWLVEETKRYLGQPPSMWTGGQCQCKDFHFFFFFFGMRPGFENIRKRKEKEAEHKNVHGSWWKQSLLLRQDWDGEQLSQGNCLHILTWDICNYLK